MYCPFCGVNVPEIEINEDAVKNHKIHESEDMHYCDTCNEKYAAIVYHLNLDGSQLV
jgi:uncharacterized protein with PIN domain